jgi:MoaA/NifB/PqqE/SkfB family radical SAM enzyme
LGKSSEASGTRGTERPFYAVERSRLSPQAGAGKRDSLILSNGAESRESDAGRSQDPVGSSQLSPIPCYWPWRVLTVSWNGEIDPCCYNNQLGSFGNIFGQPLIDVINNEKFVYARRRIVGKASDAGYDDVICKTCKGYTI